MSSLAAGDLHHRVVVDRLVKEQDQATGAINLTWRQHARLWARVTPMSGREIMAASAEHSAVTTRIMLRYRRDIDATMRVRHRGKYYNIQAVLPDNESGLEWLTLLCSEGASDGR